MVVRQLVKCIGWVTYGVLNMSFIHSVSSSKFMSTYIFGFHIVCLIRGMRRDGCALIFDAFPLRKDNIGRQPFSCSCVAYYFTVIFTFAFFL